MVGHQQVVLNGEVEAIVAGPADVERLALDSASGHIDELGENPQLDVVFHAWVVHNGAGDERKRQVPRVDREPLALSDVQARLASASLRGVLDVVVDERSGVEVLDGGSRRVGLGGVAADRLTSEQAYEEADCACPHLRCSRPRARSGALHVRMRAVGEEGGEGAVVQSLELRSR